MLAIASEIEKLGLEIAWMASEHLATTAIITTTVSPHTNDNKDVADDTYHRNQYIA